MSAEVHFPLSGLKDIKCHFVSYKFDEINNILKQFRQIKKIKNCNRGISFLIMDGNIVEKWILWHIGFENFLLDRETNKKCVHNGYI